MNTSSVRVFLSFIVLPVAVALVGGVRSADASTPAAATITRTELGRSDVPGTDLETRIYLIVFPPGAAAPVHHHPVEGIGYIIEGTARSAFGADAPVVLTAGQSFHDKAMVSHTVFVNADAKKPLKFLVAYTVKKGTPVIEVP